MRRAPGGVARQGSERGREGRRAGDYRAEWLNECLADGDPEVRYVTGGNEARALRERMAERHLRFAAAVVQLVGKLPRSAAGRHVAGQLLRCGTSPGANYEEACGAESPADFVHKMGIVLKELKESRYWLRLTMTSELLTSPIVAPVLSECQQLAAITARAVITARARYT